MPSPAIDEARGGRRPTPARSPEATQLLRLLVGFAAGALGALLGAFAPATLEGLFSAAGAPNSPSAGPTGAGGAASAGAGGGTGGGSGDDGGEAGDPGDGGIGDDPPPGTRSPTDPNYGPLDRLLDAIVSAFGVIPGLSIVLPLLQGAPMAAEGMKNARDGHAKRREALDVGRQEMDLRTKFQGADE